MRKIEILAPAGSYESMKAAVNASCDAVYIGGSKFGARAFANNLEEETMLRSIDYLHLHDKRIYMTVNTLLKEEELKGELYQYLKPYYEAGLDAAIVQDVGAAKFIHEQFPDLPIHASTQMTITSAYGANLLKEYGINRLVPARELTLEEIKTMRKQTDLEIECFVHGALCYCYSGQCLLSSMIGGRSGNRGRCAQPCRMPYTLETNGKTGYFLSPKDICTLELIPDMIEAGIDSFKIEGRMKRPEYTALCSYLYGKYTDLYLEKGREGFERFLTDSSKEFKDDKRALADSYNRGGFCSGYYKNYHGKVMMSMKRPNHYGVFVGTVKEVNGNRAKIKLSENIQRQDVLEFRDEKERAVYDYTVGEDSFANDFVVAKFKHGSYVKPGNKVYRTKNQTQLEWIGDKFLLTDAKIPIIGHFICKVGEPFSITLSYESVMVTLTKDMVQKAQNQPVTKEKITEAICKIKDTKYCFSALSGEVSLDAFLPMGAVKALRREALEALEMKILQPYRRVASSEKEEVVEMGTISQDMKTPLIHVFVHTKEQFEVARKTLEVARIYVSLDSFSKNEWTSIKEAGRENKKEIYLALPYIFREKSSKKNMLYLEEGFDGYLIHNFEEAAYLKKQGIKENLVLDSNMYTFNSYAKSFWKEHGINSFTIPIELNEREIMERGVKQDTLLVYGHIPLMISTQCVQENCLACNKTKNYHKLIDRKGKTYYAWNCCDYCYTVIYDGEAISLLEEKESVMKLQVEQIRLDFTVETAKEMQETLKTFLDVYLYGKASKQMLNTTKGHFRRGIQ